MLQIEAVRLEGSGGGLSGLGGGQQVGGVLRPHGAVEAGAFRPVAGHQGSAAAQPQTAHRLDREPVSGVGVTGGAQRRQQGLASGRAAAAGTAAAQLPIRRLRLGNGHPEPGALFP
ncbi:MAG: hypothetical protein ACKO22_01485 [Cyanobium sp.]